MRKLLLVLSSIVMIALLAACGGTAAEEAVVEEAAAEDGLSGSLSLAGSTTVQPLAELLAEAFMAENAGVEITVTGGGSSVGVKSAVDDSADLGMASREVKDSELAETPALVSTAIASDGVAVVVHPDNPVAELTLEQVAKIFSGEITNWSEVGGNDEMISVVIREESSGTRACFDEKVLSEEVLPTTTAIVQPSNGALVTTISTTPNAIGYISFGYMDESTKGIVVDGIAPTIENVVSGVYAISRNLNLISNGEASDLAQAFMDFALSAEGQVIAEEEGFISVTK